MPGDPLRRQMPICKGIFDAFARTSLFTKIRPVNLPEDILENHLNQWLAERANRVGRSPSLGVRGIHVTTGHPPFATS